MKNAPKRSNSVPNIDPNAYDDRSKNERIRAGIMAKIVEDRFKNGGDKQKIDDSNMRFNPN